jgi:hypothetical protein
MNQRRPEGPRSYTITAVDTTAEGHLYVVVDFGGGLVEGIPASVMAMNGTSGTLRW